jgi:CBS domain containing-hemolysin-like protein
VWRPRVATTTHAAADHRAIISGSVTRRWYDPGQPARDHPRSVPPEQGQPEIHPIDTALGLLAVCLLIAANAVFVAVEFGLVAVDRGRIDQLVHAGDRRAKVARHLLAHLPFSLGGAQLGISLVSLIIGFLAAPIIGRLIEPLLSPLGDTASSAGSLFLGLVIATVVQMVLGELIPKGLAIANAEPTVLRLAGPLRIFATIFKPAIIFLNGAANVIVRALGMEPKEELSHVRTLPELARVFQASAESGTLAGSASRLLDRSVRFGEKTAADVLVPRVEIRAISRDATVADLVALATETGHSRLPVYGADLDDIRGVVHVKSVHELPVADRATTPVETLMVDILAVPETRELEDVLFDMRRQRSHLVVVVDEYGGTAGILTLEDVLEEIVGEIDDEYDPLTPRLAIEESPGHHLLTGALHPDEVEEAIGFEVPEGEYETLAGFVLDQLGHIPEPGEEFTYHTWRFEVVEVDRRRIATVRVTAPLADEHQDDQHGDTSRSDAPADPHADGGNAT